MFITFNTVYGVTRVVSTSPVGWVEGEHVYGNVKVTCVKAKNASEVEFLKRIYGA
jgi:hypothetical protein